MTKIVYSKYAAAKWDHLSIQIEERGNIFLTLRCECGKQIFCDTYLDVGTSDRVRIEFSHLEERYPLLVRRDDWVGGLDQGITKVGCGGFVGMTRWYGSVVSEEVEVGGDWTWE